MKNAKPSEKTISTIITAAVTADAAVSDFLATLNFATKRNGGKNGDGKTATMCVNPATPRLTLPARLRTDGWTCGLVGRTADGGLQLVLAKKRFNNGFTAFHSTQHFITVLGETAETLRKLSYTFTLSDETVDETTGLLTATLTPNGDVYKH